MAAVVSHAAASEMAGDTEQAVAAELARGKYLTYVAGCHACHTDHQQTEQWLAGGAAISTPFGEFFPPNITPDPETGIGGWSDDDFARALQHGIAPDGRRYYPVFPYTSYSRLRADDVRAIKRFLDQIPPVRQVNRPHQLRSLGRWPSLLGLWQWLNLQPEWTALPDIQDDTLRRGAYLVEAVSHCGECHSPRDGIGATRYRDWLRGARLSSGRKASNLTTHPDGLAAWEPEELVSYLETGRTDMGAKARHEMREFVDHAGRYLSETDRAAIAAYLFALPERADRRGCRQQGPRLSRCSN